MNKKIIKIESTQKSNILNVRWAPNNICNFKCKYCFPDAHAGTNRSPTDLQLVIKNFRSLFDYYKVNLKKNKFHLHISGGEPTLWPELGEFIKQIKQTHDVYVSVVSNGSRTIRWWEEYGSYIDNAILSFHVAQANVDHHISVADTLHFQGKKVTVLVLMDPTRWDESVQAIEYMKSHSKNPWFIQSKSIVDFNPYDKIQKKFMSNETKRWPNVLWFIKNLKLLFNGSINFFESRARLSDGSFFFATSNTYINNNLNSFYGWDCSIGLESIYIHWTGDIQGACGQILFNQKNNYNILNEDFQQTFKPNLSTVKCKILKCTCSPETHVTKIKFQ
jgi:organic radical activating enzyme